MPVIFILFIHQIALKFNAITIALIIRKWGWRNSQNVIRNLTK
jgi:hypothetical protein